jgi:hypothetical protein
MPIDKAGHHSAVAGIEHAVGFGVGRRVEFGDALAIDQDRLDRLLRICQFAGKELADVLDQKCRQRRLLLVRKPSMHLPLCDGQDEVHDTAGLSY